MALKVVAFKVSLLSISYCGFQVLAMLDRRLVETAGYKALGAAESDTNARGEAQQPQLAPGSANARQRSNQIVQHGLGDMTG